MIANLSGILARKSAESVIVDVAGVGYEVYTPLSTYMRLPEEGRTVSLNVYTHLKEDAIQLFGFLTSAEKDLFTLLIGVSGVGPKLARNILSGIEVAELVSALSTGDVVRLSAIPGIGAKSAERLVLELKDKVRGVVAASAGAPKGSVAGDAVSALLNLGYKSAQAEDAVKKAKDRFPGAKFEELLRESLKGLSKR
ncbi:MAG: Holliday junction branch migration protein RuvA [Deltaproteobacteria bacterium]|nr:Holliday junction branch migration protein RuvA [Deltaproteobacteria bacterium]